MGQNCKQERFAIACEKVIGSLWSARIQYERLYRAWCAVLLVMMIMVSSAQVISVTGVNQKIADPWSEWGVVS